MFKSAKLVFLSSALVILSGCGGSSSTPNVPGTSVSVTKAQLTLQAQPAFVTVGSPTVLGVTVTNTTTSSQSGIAFTVALPSGTKSANSLFTSTSGCSVNSTSVGSNLSVSGMTVPAGSACSATFTITPNAAGTYDFAATGLTNVELATPASLTVN